MKPRQKLTFRVAYKATFNGNTVGGCEAFAK